MKKVLLLRSMFFLVLLLGCEKEELSGTVKYEVTCSPGGFDITYENSGGNTEQKTISTTSWTTSFTGKKDNFVYVSAQANNKNAKITAKIFYQNKIIEEATSSGDYVIATASGSLP